MKKWNRKNALWMLLYLVLYMVGTVITCVLGSVHPIMFVSYQIVAGILLSGIVVTAFARIKEPGVTACFSLGIVLVFILINDVSAWHIIPLIVIGVIAEIIRVVTKYSWIGDVVSTVVMTFPTFGFYGQIWFNRDFTYSEAIEEMPAGYADALMKYSPMWALPIVLVAGIALSILISNFTAKIFKLEK